MRKNKRKTYKIVTLVCDYDGVIFHEKLTKRISECQNEGYEVEVQYQLGENRNEMHFTALVLGYKMEED